MLSVFMHSNYVILAEQMSINLQCMHKNSLLWLLMHSLVHQGVKAFKFEHTALAIDFKG